MGRGLSWRPQPDISTDEEGGDTVVKPLLQAAVRALTGILAPVLTGLMGITLAAILVLAVPQAGRAEPAPPIRIGATVSLSGKYEEPSLMVRDAMKLWERQVNQRGGLLDRPVQLILHDDQSQPQRVRELYHQLLNQDKVDLVFSPYGTELTLAASEVSEHYQNFMLAVSASGEVIWQQGYKYICGIHAPAKRYMISFLDVMARQGLESVAIIYEDSPFTKAAAQGAREWAPRLGLKVNYFQVYHHSQSEFPLLVRKSLATRADGLILCAYAKDSYAFLALLKEAGARPRALCLTIAPALPDFYQQAGSMAEGVFCPSQWEPDTRIPYPGTKEFIESFKNFARRPPSYQAGTAYAACQILEKAITQTRSLDQKKLRDFVQTMDTVTVVGRFRVDHTGMQVGHVPILIQWQQGKKEIVYPRSMQTAAPKF